MSDTKPDLSPTALYTAGVWTWAHFPGAELLDHRDSRAALGAVTVALAAARPFHRRPPSLRHSLVQRHVMIDRLLADSGCQVCLELAAGLSARGIRASADPSMTYVEVDRPGVIERKRGLLERTSAGREVLERKNLRLVAGDVAEVVLADLVPSSPTPLFVIAEGLLVYLDAAAQRALWARVAALLQGRGGTLAFDLVPAIEQPEPGAVGNFLGGLMRKVTRGGEFVRDTRSRQDIAGELRAAGFDEVTILEPATAPRDWQVPHLDERTQQLVFVARRKPTKI